MKYKINNLFKYLNYRLTSFTEHDVHSPFVFNFYMELIKTKHPFHDFYLLNNTREKLLKNRQTITMRDFGAGSKKLHSNQRCINQITKYGIAPKKQAEFLYRLINFLKPTNIIELGTSVGLTTLYLAKPNSKTTVYTLEGAEELVQFSTELFKEHHCSNIKSITGNFNDTFPHLINQLQRIDVLYIDGNHAYEPTIHYFNLALAKKTEQSVFIVDDINWSTDMQRAWQYIYTHKEVTLSLDFFYFGIVFFRKETIQKEHFTLYF